MLEFGSSGFSWLFIKRWMVSLCCCPLSSLQNSDCAQSGCCASPCSHKANFLGKCREFCGEPIACRSENEVNTPQLRETCFGKSLWRCCRFRRGSTSPEAMIPYPNTQSRDKGGKPQTWLIALSTHCFLLEFLGTDCCTKWTMISCRAFFYAHVG